MNDGEDKKLTPVAMNGRGVQLTKIEEFYRFGQYVVKSGLAPTAIDTPEKAMIAMQTGIEAGMTPMAALNAVAVVKGKATWYSKSAKGRVLSSGVCTHWDQGVEGLGDDRRGWVKSRRKGIEGVKETRFSVRDAKGLGLWGRNEWARQSDNMLLCRAIGRHCADWYSDVMLNLRTFEEVRDADWPDKPKQIEATDKPDPLLSEPEERDAEIVNGDDELFPPSEGTSNGGGETDE